MAFQLALSFILATVFYPSFSTAQTTPPTPWWTHEQIDNCTSQTNAALAQMSTVSNGIFDKYAASQSLHNCYVTAGCTAPPAPVSDTSACYAKMVNLYYDGKIAPCLYATARSAPMTDPAYESNGLSLVDKMTTVGKLMSAHLSYLQPAKTHINDIPYLQSASTVSSLCSGSTAQASATSCIANVRAAAQPQFNAMCTQATSVINTQITYDCMNRLYLGLEQQGVCTQCGPPARAQKASVIAAAKADPACQSFDDASMEKVFTSNLPCPTVWQTACGDFGKWWEQGLKWP